MSEKVEVKKKDTQSSTASKKPIKKVFETDEMVIRIFKNALAEMERRQLAKTVQMSGDTLIVIRGEL